jgi:RHS repeat-associated protein
MCKPLVLMTSLAMVLNILVPVIRPVPAQARPVASPPHARQGSGDRPSRVLRPLTGATAWIEGPHAPAVLSPSSSISISAAEAAISAPTVPVSITESGFDPATVTVTAGETVEWTNRTQETVHLVSGEPYRIYLPLVVRNTAVTGATAASPPVTAAFTAQQQDDWANVDIAPGESYVHTFTTTGNHPYFLAGYPDRTGLVVVQRAHVPDFALAVAPDLRTVTQGQSVTYTAALTAMDGFTAPVALSVLGLPAGAAPAWSANPVTPAGSAVLTITTATSTPAGTHNITVSGTGGGRTHDVPATLIVERLPRPDFVLDAWPATQTLTCGLGISYTVAVTAVDGFAQAVTLGVGGAPAGAAIAWATNPLTPTADTTLAITPSVSGPFGTFTLVITGTAGIVHTRQVGLVVVEPCIPLPDLVIEDITFVPDVAFTDETVTGTVTVRNQGDAPAGPFRTDWYVDPASPPGAGETGDGYWELPGLDVGATAKLTLTHSFATAGNHQLYAQVDTMDAVTEILETNNVDGEPLAVVDQIDGACGDIITDTTWYPGTLYHVTCDVRVLEGVTLTLEPGVVVQFGNSDGMIVNGALVADGAAMAPIRLTADTDVPSPGYWDGVWFGSSSENSILSHVTVEYAGNTSTAYRSGLYLESDQVTVAHSHVRLNQGYGLRLAAGASPTITSTTFTSNTSYAAYVSYASSSPSNPQFVNNAGSGNQYNGVGVSGAISGTVHWMENSQFPYIIGDVVSVDSGASLAIDPPTVVKFNWSNGELHVRGTLTADASAGDEIIFTSLRDDDYGGDTNNDGSATMPAAGDWDQIRVHAGGMATFDHAVVRYGRSNESSGDCGMLRNEGDLVLTNSDVSFSLYDGLCHFGSRILVDGCTFAHNGGDGARLHLSQAAPPAQLANNVFTGNGDYAAYIDYGNNRTLSTANNTGAGNGTNGIYATGGISGTVQWAANADFPYVAALLTVNDGASLAIAPGTVVKFWPDVARSLDVYGTLTADASAGDEVIFTSLRDDDYGGDTNNDGSATTPAADDWGNVGIRIYGAATLDHAVVRYGRGSEYNDNCGMVRNEGDLVLTNSDVSFSRYDGLCHFGSRILVDGCTFAHNGGDGARLHLSQAAPPAQLANNVFTGNGDYAAYIDYGNNRTLSTANNAGAGNGTNGIYATGSISGTVQWAANADFPYVAALLTVNDGASLTIAPGTVVKFPLSIARSLDVYGTLTADASAGDEVIFTSLRDDDYGGDTNNDGSATAPVAGDWGNVGIRIYGAATLDHAVVRYGRGSEFSDNCGMLRNEGDLVLTNSDVSFSRYDGLCTRGPSVTISGNSFHGNVRYGVYNVNTSVQVNAENNWWGSYDGPDPYGSGDGINYRTCYRDSTPYVCEHYVDADPWIGKDYWDSNIAGQDVPWVGYAADPVNTANGNYTCKHADLSIPARGDLRLDFVRSYNAIHPQDGPLGHGWSHSYGISVSEVVTEVFVSHADGRQDRFVWNGSTYEPNPGTFSTLVKQSGTFTLTLKDRTVYAFDALGRLARILDRNGNTLVLSYTGNQLSTVTAPGGLALAFDHDPDGHITRVTGPIGRSIGFTYNISGDLTVVTDTQGFTTFTYDADHRLLTATDANGATFVRNSYDDQGRVVAQRYALDNPTTFAYYEFDHITAVTDPLGHTTTHEYDGDRRLITQTNGLGGSVVDAYDACNNRTTSTDERGFTTRTAYDERGNPTVITDALDTTTTMRYDAQDNLLQITDARGYSTLYEYDTHGNLITRTDALSGTLVNALDEYGQIVSRVDEAGNTTRFGYDLYGHRTVVTNALGYAARQVVDPAGRLIAETDALGHTTTYAYDAANHTVAVTNTLNQVTRSAYDPIGHQTAVTDATGVAITYTYDLKGRLIAESDGAGHLTHYGYDALDRRDVVTDALGYTTHYGYDGLSHLVAITDALGGTTRYTYDAAGNRTSVTDANGNTTRYGFDALGRTVAITDALGGVTRYGFDGVGNRAVITDANSHVTTMGYDPLNRLVWTAGPLSRSVRHSYDPLGHVTVITRADGTEIAQTYDPLGQVTLRSTPDGTIAYQYDALGSRVAMTDTTGTTRYTYDGLGQLLQVAQPGSAPVTYAYDAAGNRTHLTYPDGRVVTYTYGAAHRLAQVTDWASRVVSYTYDALGRPVAQYNPNGTTVSFEHDALDRAVAITHESTVSGTFGFFRYAYDAVGNRTVMTDGLGATGHQYDALYRVSGVDYPDGESITYAYDAMGNRLALTSTVHGTVTYTYDAADQLLASGPITFAWDLNGNLIARSGVSYTWDDLNRLAAVVSKTDVVTFTYNGDGARVARSVNGAATTTIQDVGLPLPYVLEEANGSGTTRYVYGLDMLAHETPAGAPFHYHHDALGSTRHLSNQSGQAVAGYAYDAFGAVRWTRGSAGTDFTFAGEQADPATGLYFLRARYYDPALGRFISGDPCPGDVAQPWTLNRYVYCANNPVNSSPAPTAAGRAGCTTHPGPAARGDRRPRGCAPLPTR